MHRRGNEAAIGFCSIMLRAFACPCFNMFQSVLKIDRGLSLSLSLSGCPLRSATGSQIRSFMDHLIMGPVGHLPSRASHAIEINRT